MAGQTVVGIAQIDGLDELLRRLERLGADVEGELRDAGLDGGRVIAREANSLAPGPHVDVEIEKASREHVTVAIGPVEDKWYYRFFELGATEHEIAGQPLLAFEGDEGLIVVGGLTHPGMAAQPFLRPAFDGKKDEAVEAIADRLRRVVEGVCESR